MITYNNIIDRFEKFVTDNFFLKTFTHGSPSGVDLDKFEVYPALHVVYTGSNYDSTSKEYSFEVYILDLPPDKAKKIENQTQLVSNAEQVAEDILSDMRNGGVVFDFGHLYTVTSASTTPLEDTTSNSLAGILLTISIEVGFTLDSCNAPLSGVNPSGSQFPVAGASALQIVEVDGSPDVSNVTKIIVSNGTLVDNGSGSVTIDTGGGGSSTLASLTDVDVTGVVNNNTLVYDSAQSKWVDGYPTSSGVVSTCDFLGNKALSYTVGLGTIEIGTLLGGDFTLDQKMRVGNSFGTSLSNSIFKSSSLSSGSSYRIQGEVEVQSSAVSQLFSMSIYNAAGFFSGATLFTESSPSTDLRTIAFDTGVIAITPYEYVNTFQFQYTLSGTTQIRIKSFTITFTNA